MLRRRGKFLKDILGSELKLQEGGAQKTREVLEGHPGLSTEVAGAVLKRRGKFLKDILGSELKLQEGGAQKTRQVLEKDAGLRTAVAAGGRSEDAASS